MDSKREQALVGLFVIIAAGLLIVTIFLISGSFTKGEIPYRSYFKNAGGLAPGAEVHYAGGPPIGRVKKVAPDPQDPTRMLVEFVVNPDVPVRTDTRASITSSSPLSENYLGLLPGSKSAPPAPAGSVLPSTEYVSFADISDMISQLAPNAQELIKNLNARVTTLQETLDRVNDVLNDANRSNIAGTLAELHATLKEDRPLIHDTLVHIDALSTKLEPLIDNVKTTSTDADHLVKNLDGTISENRENLRASVQELRTALASADSLLAQLDNLTTANSENLDEIIINLRTITENLNSFTETIKTRPYTLIRSANPKEHKPGEGPSK
ncbi:MAG TPA: MlaD family protein [Candidatus Acidoferrum sp.]|nr:MlaD family protein [Candidatus Acidoferrum sp.]